MSVVSSGVPPPPPPPLSHQETHNTTDVPDLDLSVAFRDIPGLDLEKRVYPLCLLLRYKISVGELPEKHPVRGFGLEKHTRFSKKAEKRGHGGHDSLPGGLVSASGGGGGASGGGGGASGGGGGGRHLVSASGGGGGGRHHGSYGKQNLGFRPTSGKGGGHTGNNSGKGGGNSGNTESHNNHSHYGGTLYTPRGNNLYTPRGSLVTPRGGTRDRPRRQNNRPRTSQIAEEEPQAIGA